MTGRLPSIIETPDAAALTAALRADGVLPAWTEPYSRDAFALAGYLDADDPTRLSPAGRVVAARWTEIKEAVHGGFARDGRFTPHDPRGARNAI